MWAEDVPRPSHKYNNMFIQTVYLFLSYGHTVVMVVILNNSSFQFSKVHAQFQGY